MFLRCGTMITAGVSSRKWGYQINRAIKYKIKKIYSNELFKLIKNLGKFAEFPEHFKD